MNKFEQWLSSINESLTSPVKTEPEVNANAGVDTETTTIDRTDAPSSNREDMMSDVDAIMQSLEVLSKELTEELESMNAEPLDEADSTAKKVIDWTFRAPKARNAQKKVNSMILKIADVEAAKDSYEGDKKEVIASKVKALKDQAAAAQKAVDDKFKEYGPIVTKALSSEKIKGKLEVLKTQLGDDSYDKNEIKDQAKKLMARLRDEEAALKEEEPSKEEQKEVVDKKKEAAAKKAPAKKEEGTSEAVQIIREVETLIIELHQQLSEYTEPVNEESADDTIWNPFKAAKEMFKKMAARKAQRKVNAMDLKIANLEAAVGSYQGDQKKALEAKIESLKDQAKLAQMDLNKRFEDSGVYVERALRVERLKGRMEVLKVQLGDDSYDQNEIKVQAAKLMKRMKEEEAAMQEDDAELQARAEEERLRREDEEIEKRRKAAAKAPATSTPAEPVTQQVPAGTPEPTEVEPVTQQQNPAVAAIEDKIKEYEEAIDSLKDKTDAGTKDKIAMLQAAVNSEKAKLQKAKEVAAQKESLVVRATEAGLNELAKEIESKLDWQVTESTVLGMKYDALIKKAESTRVLNESRHFNDNVKDAFRRLI